MPNGSQTDAEEKVSGEALESIYNFAEVDNQANITDSPSTLSPDTHYIKQIQAHFPEYRGKNAHALKRKLLVDDKFLDEVTTKLFTQGIQSSPEAKSHYADEENYVKDYKDLKRNIRRTVGQGAVTGESTKKTIVDRYMKLDKPPSEAGSASWRNNNPLNIMSTSISDDLEEKVRSQGIEYKPSDITNEDGTLAEFGSYEDGWKAARMALKEGHADSTVHTALKKWSNGGYDGSIVDESMRDKKIKDLSPEQLDIVMKRMEQYEGWITPENDPFSNSMPLEDYKESIKENPENYEEFGIVDEEGNLTDQDDKVLIELINQNEGLKKKLVEDRYQNFEEVLDNEYNSIKSLVQNPSVKAQSFAVYDQFGSEGLTNYINILQRQFLGEEAVSESEAKKALDWYRSNDVGRVTRRFIGRGENRLSFVPPKATFEMKAEIPEDVNYWTADKYSYNKESNEFEVRSDEQIARSLLTKWGNFEEWVGIGKEAKEGRLSQYTNLNLLPKNVIEAIAEDSDINVEDLREEYVSSIVNREESGFFNSKGYSFLLANATNELKKQGKIQSLIKTIQANGNYLGENRWAINYDDADLMTKIAVDALNQDDQYRAIVKSGTTSGSFLGMDVNKPDENTMILDLERMENVKGQINDVMNTFYSEETVYDEESGEWQTKPKEGIMNWTWNGLTSIPFGVAQAVDYYAVSPWMEMSQGAMEQVANAVDIIDPDGNIVSDSARDLARWFDWHTESDLVEGVNNFSMGAFMGESDIDMIRNSDNWFYEFPAKLTPIWQYALSVYMSTKGLLGLGQKAASLLPRIGNASKSISSAQAAKVLKSSKMENYVARWQQSIGNTNWGTAGTYIFGDVVMESALPKHKTLANVGTTMLDQAIEKFEGTDPNYNEKYKATSGILRTGVDATTSFALSVLFDGLVGSSKYLKDVYRGKVRGKRVPTLIEKTTKSGKRQKKTLGEGEWPEWRPDLREFTANITHEMDEWAIGNFQQSLLKQLTSSTRNMVTEGDETVADFTLKTAREINEFFGDDIYDILEESVRYYNGKFGGPDFTEAQINQIATENYEQFVSQFGDTMYNIFKANRNGERVPLKVANALERGTITVKEFTKPDGRSRFTLDEANEIAGESITRLVKKVGDDEYAVQEVKPNYWMVDVSKRIRKKALASDPENPIGRQLDEEGINPRMDDLSEAEQKRVEEVTNWWYELYGQEVSAGNTRGFINGLGTEKGFRVITEDGDIIDNIAISLKDQDVDEGLGGYIKGKSEGIEDSFNLNHQSYTDMENISNAVRRGRNSIDGSVDEYKQKLRDQLDLFFRTKELQSKAQSGKPFLFGSDEFRNRYGFSEKIAKFFSRFRESGRPTYGMVETIARNFGLDDARIRNLVRITRNGNEKRIIGKKNVGPIREWDSAKASKKGVPKDVLVKRTNRDGQEMFFVSRRKTKAPPSRMVLTQDGLRFNPDWDMVNVNQTLTEDGSIQQFTEIEIDGEAWYRPAQDGDEGVLLNIQNPKKTSNGELGMPLEDAASRDIDGLVTEQSGVTLYKPISPEDQVFDPDQVIKEADRSGITIKKPKETTKEEAVKLVAQANLLPKGLLHSVGTGFVGSIIGEQVDWAFGSDDDYTEGAAWGLALGALFGNKAFRGGVKKVLKASGDKSLDVGENFFYKLREWSGEYENNILEKELYNTGYDTRKQDWKEWKEGFYGRLHQAGNSGQSMVEAIKDNKVVKSMFSMLEKYADIPLVKQLQHRLLNVEHAPTELQTRVTMLYNRKVGSDDAYASFNEDKVNFIREWYDEMGIGEGAQISERKAREVFDDALWRIMNSNGRIADDGTFRFDSIENVQRAYDRGNENALKQLDEALLRHEKLGKYPEALRDWFKSIKDEYLGAITNKKEAVLGNVRDRFNGLAQRMYGFSGTFNQFRKSLGADDKKLLREALQDPAFVKLRDLKSTRDAFTDLGPNYYPAIFSRQKMRDSQQRFVQNYLRENPESNKKEAIAEFQNDLKREFYEINKRQGGRPQILEKVSWAERRLEEEQFESLAEAKNKLEYEFIKNEELGYSDKEIAELMEVRDQYVNEHTVTEINEEGVLEERTYFSIQEPQELADIYGLVERANHKSHNDFFELISSGFHIKNSNHLERPRKYQLPDRIAEKNHENIMFKYTQDVGSRLHFVRDGIFDESDFKQKYLSNITRQLKKKLGEDSPEVQKFASRLMDIYKQQNGIPKAVRSFNDKAEAIDWYKKKARASKLVQTWRNLIGAGYIYGISFYDWFQHAIFTPLLTSWGSYKNSVVMLGSDRQAFDRMKNVAKTFHYADQKAKTFMPEISGGQYAEADTDWFTDNSFKFAKWLREGAAGFSMTKMASKTGMFDIDDWGIFNMLGGSFYDVNETATSINVMAHLIEAEELARVGRMMKEQDTGIIRVPTRTGGEKVYTQGDVRSGLARIGIEPENYDDFLQTNKELNDIVDYVREGEQREINLRDFDTETQGFKYLENIVNTAVDSYHGRNKMARPLLWNTDVGKLAAQYSFYHQNFALQTTQRRIRQPIQQWEAKYGKQLADDVPMWKMVNWLQQGDAGLEKLRGIEGMTDEAINDLPINAYYTMAKFLPAVGLTFLMETGREAWQDLALIATDLAAESMGGDVDKEHRASEGDYGWERVSQTKIINPHASKENQVTWAEVREDPELRQGIYMLGWALGHFANLGTAGRWGTTAVQAGEWGIQSTLEVTPIGREIEDMVKFTGHALSVPFNGPVDAAEGTSKKLYDWTSRKIPVIGSFGLARNKVKDAVFNKPKSPTRVYDTSSGNTYDISNYSLQDF